MRKNNGNFLFLANYAGALASTHTVDITAGLIPELAKLLRVALGAKGPQSVRQNPLNFILSRVGAPSK